MSAANEIHVGDIGTVFRQTITDCGSIVDLSGVASLQICFKKPDNEVVTVAATFTNVGTDGLMDYTIPNSAFLDQEGCWSWQGIIHFGATQLWHTNVLEFEVFSNVCE
jgi:hypothetical protein